MFEFYLNVNPKNYKTVRKVLNLSVSEFATIAHTTRQTVSNFEKGETSPIVTIGLAMVLEKLACQDMAAAVVWNRVVEKL